MNLLLAAALVCGCNQALGLDRTQSIPIDAPPVCPPIGTAPAFSDIVRQGILQPCGSFSATADGADAIATCGGVVDTSCDFVPQIAEGPPTGPLAPITLPLASADDLIEYAGVVETPEGDEIYAALYNAPLAQFRYGAFARASDGTWTWGGYRGQVVPGTLGVPSRGPNRHALVYGSDTFLHELVEDASGMWSEHLPAYTSSELPEPFSRPDLSPDGLRVAYVGVDATLEPVIEYADRPSIDARFAGAQVLAGVPGSSDGPFMSADCERLYFSGLGYILYVER
ncbi:MAG TPA: hypothetical protein VGF94_26050 [Kofleriaceae bacterium]|jgi:hypothetical protein